MIPYVSLSLAFRFHNAWEKFNVLQDSSSADKFLSISNIFLHRIFSRNSTWRGSWSIDPRSQRAKDDFESKKRASNAINQDQCTNGTVRVGTRNQNFIRRSCGRLSSKSVVRLHSTALKYRQTGLIVPPFDSRARQPEFRIILDFHRHYRYNTLHDSLFKHNFSQSTTI